MADEKTTEASDSGAASASSGSYDQWFGAAGIDAKSLPDAGEIKAARDFYSKYSGESELYSKSQVEESKKAAISDWLKNPDTYQRLNDYFTKLNGSQAASAQSSAGHVDDPVAQQFDALKKELNSRLGSHESVLAELMQLRNDLTKQGEQATWQKQFTERVKGTVKQAGGRWSSERIEREVMRRYAAGELRDDSPAGIAKAVKAVLSEKDSERKEAIRELADAGALRQDSFRLKPDMKLKDVFKDRDQLDALLEEVMNRGLPDGRPA